MTPSHQARTASPPHRTTLWTSIQQIEKRQWWLWTSAIVTSILLAVGIAHLSVLPPKADPQFALALRNSLRGVVILVLLFDAYTIYQQLEIHRIRKQFTDQQEMFRLITENAEDLIALIDRDGRRLYVSPAYKKIFGYTPDDLLGTSAVEQIHPEDRDTVLAARKTVYRTGAGPRLEYRFPRKDGEWRILESSASPVRNHRGEIETLVVVSRDITERKQAEERLRQREEQLRQAQKMEAVGRLSGGIAHDFNNLLGVIIGYSESMESRLTPDDPLRKSAEEIRKAGERAAALTHQLLAFSRQQVLQPKVLDLNSVVTDMGKMLRRLIGADIELTTKLASQLGQVKADQSQIEQVIVNLVVNARDAMPDGGKLLIETSNTFIDEAMARSLPFLHPGPHVLLTVTDSGVGMDTETQRHVFEPFFTTKAPGKGTGLGLATVYGVVKQSGGVVGIDSSPGRGAAFKIFLPQASEIAIAPVPDLNDRKSSMGSGTILLVEDEEALRDLTAEQLSDSGFKVLSARDGIHALDVARSYDDTIHLLLTDVMMPKLGGPALARYISHLRPETRILFMTGHAELDAVVQGGLPEGAESLQKPFARDTLLKRVRQLIDTVQVPVSN